MIGQGRINCMTADQLKMVLRRAGSTPLDLYMATIPEAEMLRLIVSHSSPIQSLTIDYSEVTIQNVVNNLHYLDLHDLKLLRVIEVPYYQITKVMDLARKSTRQEMDIEIYSSERVHASFLKHDLLQRISRLYIGTCERTHLFHFIH
jgi:hypothetical protein